MLYILMLLIVRIDINLKNKVYYSVVYDASVNTTNKCIFGALHRLWVGYHIMES